MMTPGTWPPRTATAMTSAVNGPTPGSWVSTLNPRAGPGTLDNLPAEPVDPDQCRVDQRQAILDHLAGGGGPWPEPSSRTSSPPLASASAIPQPGPVIASGGHACGSFPG
jgi:hypothetical protein